MRIGTSAKHRPKLIFMIGLALFPTVLPAIAFGDAPADPDVHFQYLPGKGLEARQGDGRMRLITRVRAQFQYSVLNDSAEDQDAEQSFQIRRARLQFLGNFFGRHNKFKIELAYSPRDLSLTTDPVRTRRTPLLTWYGEFDHLRDLTIRLGQYKVPYSRQRVISSGNLQLVDRSIVNGEFNVDRDVGLDIRSKDFLGLGMLRYYLYVGVGEGRDAFQRDDFGMMYIARAEFLPLGMFKDYSEGDLKRTRTPKLSIGAAYAFVDNAKGNRGILGSRFEDGGTTDYHNVTVDLMAKWLGFSLQSEFMWRDGKRFRGDALDDMGNAVPTEAARNGFGWFIQAGHILKRIPLEFSARYALIRSTGDSSLSDANELGAAVSYYFARHPLKLQTDYFRLWNQDGFGDGRDQLRVQLQAAF